MKRACAKYRKCSAGGSRLKIMISEHGREFGTYFEKISDIMQTVAFLQNLLR